MATTSDIRNGMVMLLDNELYTVIDFLHVKPGKGGAFVRTKLKRITDGSVIDRTFRSGERIEEVRLEEREMQFLYKDGELYNFMDNETYEQLSVSEKVLEEEAIKFLKENVNVKVQFHGDEAVRVDLPIFVELKVVQTEPGVRGDTASGGSKPAKLETGAVVQVPLFIDEGIVIRVDTRSGKYVERA
jgi:elongation factor P